MPRPKRIQQMTKEQERAHRFPELSPENKEIAGKVLEERNLDRMFNYICKNLGYSRVVKSRIGDDAKSTFGFNLNRILSSYNPTSGSPTLRNYILTCFRNAIIQTHRSHYRRGKHEKQMLQTKPGEIAALKIAKSVHPAAEVMEKEHREIVVDAVMSLPDGLKKPLWLSAYSGKSNKEIADELGITTGSVKTLLYEAKKRVIATLKKTNPSLFFLISANSSSERLETFLPSSRYCPLVGVSRQPSICMSVDLPDPDGPMIATNSPSFITNDAFLRATVSMSPLLYILDKFLHSII